MERYPNPNGGISGSIPDCEVFSLLDGKNQDSIHRKVGSKPHLAPRGSLGREGPTRSISRRIARRCILLILSFLTFTIIRVDMQKLEEVKVEIFFLLKCSHRPFVQLDQPSNLEWCLCFEHIVQSHPTTCLSGVHCLSAKPCHLPLKYRYRIKKSDHIRWPTQTLLRSHFCWEPFQGHQDLSHKSNNVDGKIRTFLNGSIHSCFLDTCDKGLCRNGQIPCWDFEQSMLLGCPAIFNTLSSYQPSFEYLHI